MNFRFQISNSILQILATILLLSCTPQKQTNQDSNSEKSPNKPAIIADKFAYPVGKQEFLTEAKDNKDDWYNATNFGETNHLGEDWNKNSGGNTDCGEPVYAIGNGTITYAKDAGIGWGNVVIIEHTLADGKKVQSLYGHLQEILKTEGEVKKREKIGTIGNANGKYLCHLHLEIRDETCLSWNQVGGGYSNERNGWLDASEFIDKFR
jgi:murein DD-endopeptidase MepM/ murein hydrolase activator NlpD